MDECVWWYVTMEKCCKVELLLKDHTEKAPKMIRDENAIKQANAIVGSKFAGWFQYQGLYRKMVKDQPDCLL